MRGSSGRIPSSSLAREGRIVTGQLRRRAIIESLETRLLLSTTYYVSPSGSDANAGTNPAAPWQTVAKVDATTFNPGDQILFQRGGQWHESLNASSSGTVAAPITYGAYGSANLPNPLFIGSDPLNNASFTLVSGTTSTYSLTTVTAIGWVFDNHQFTHHSTDALGGSGDFTTNLNYVNSTPESWYQSGSTLYVNVGGSLTGHVLTAAVRQDAVYSNSQNNLVFTNLDVTETAADNAGYAFRIFNSSNVQVLNCNASLAGKHHFGVIDSIGFVGRNLVATDAPPDLGYGGASAFVSYSDATRLNDTSQWIDDTWLNPNGPYPAFISHGDGVNSISSLLVQNMNCPNGWGTGIVVYTTGPAERVVITGGLVQGASVVSVGTDYSTISGMTITGDSSVSLGGSHDIVQGCTFTGKTKDPGGGYNGYVVDSGQYNTIQFNTFSSTPYWSNAIGIMNVDSNTQCTGNIFNCQVPYVLFFHNSNGTVSSNDNLFLSNAIIGEGDWMGGGVTTYSFAQWQTQFGEDSRSLVAPNAQLDLGSGSLVIPGGNIAAVNFFLQTGYDGGKWDGLGIISSAAAQDATHLTTLGAILNNNGSGSPIYTTFDGQSVGPADVLVKYTYYGDADLSGHVDGTDFSLIDHGFSADQANPGSAMGWQNGDFNYDGKIDGSDYSLIDNAFNMQGIFSLPASATAEIQPAASSSDASTAIALPKARRLAVPAPVASAADNAWMGSVFNDRRLDDKHGLLKGIFD